MRDRQIRDIQGILNGGFPRLTFSEPLESAFIAQYVDHAVSTLRRNVGFVFLIYCVLGFGVYTISPPESISYWPLMHTAVGLCILTAWICVHLPRLNRLQPLYTGACAGIGLFITVLFPYFLDNAIIFQLSQVGEIYALIIIYTSVGLRFMAACITCWGAGLAAVMMGLLLGIEFDWLAFHEFFTGGSVLGMCMGYLSEHRTRTVFLQSQLLTLEKENSEALAQKMERMSREDGLTGLANRRYFDIVFEREWRRAHRNYDPISVMFIDIDHFKLFNDFYGHQRGDECIRIVAEIVGQQAKRAGDLAARYGGEEFVVIFTQTGPEELKMIGERTRMAIQEAGIHHEPSAVADVVTVSIGLASCIPDDGKTMDALLARADGNLYQAKADGRNQCVYGNCND